MPIVAVSSTLERAGARAAADAGADDDLFSSQIPKPLTKATAEDLVARFVLTQKHTPLEPTGSGGAGGGSGDANASSPGGRNSSSSSSSSSSSGSSGGIVDVGPGVNGSHSLLFSIDHGYLGDISIQSNMADSIQSNMADTNSEERLRALAIAGSSSAQSSEQQEEKKGADKQTAGDIAAGQEHKQLEEEEDDYFLSSCDQAAEV
jgi:hypothetical protein